MYKLGIISVLMLAQAMSACAPQKGEYGEQGERGSDGSTIVGPVGPTGPQGPVGADGQIATIVNLCPGTTTYSSVFVEVAMCINNRLYAVYSAHGGFLTELPPGNYSSNAIGSACNLTVSANCVVTPY